MKIGEGDPGRKNGPVTITEKSQPPRRILFEPQPRRFEQGERIETPLKGLDGTFVSNKTFTILEKKGEGYAGQVYKVVNETTGDVLAIKALRPESESKERARDTLFRLTFGANFSPATDESAVRYGLIWQKLLRRGAKKEFLSGESVIPEPHGYFWNEKLQTFVEVHEWIDGNNPHLEDPQVQAKKRGFMDRIVALAEEMGAYQIARQYKWWTLLAGANVLERRDGALVAVDWRSGIALPFLLPLSPSDIPIIANNLKKGHFANFDYADFNKLDRFILRNYEDFADLLPLVDELRELDGKYHKGRKQATIADWQREFQLDDAVASELQESPLGYRAQLVLDGLPLVGLSMHRFLTSRIYRRHIKNILADRNYRNSWFSKHRTYDIDSWQNNDRITPAKTNELSEKTWLYMLHKVFFSHLPAPIQKITDITELRRRLHDALTPMRIAISQEEQIRWLRDRIDGGVELGLISPMQADALRQQAQEKRMRSYVVEMATVVPGIELSTMPILPAILILTDGNLAIAAAVLTSPVTIGGAIRSVYTVIRAISEIPSSIRQKTKKPVTSRLSGLPLAPWKVVGTLFVLPQMVTYYPEMARFLTSYAAIKSARKVPVYGVEGGTLEYLVYKEGQKLIGRAKIEDPEKPKTASPKPKQKARAIPIEYSNFAVREQRRNGTYSPAATIIPVDGEVVLFDSGMQKAVFRPTSRDIGVIDINEGEAFFDENGNLQERNHFRKSVWVASGKNGRDGKYAFDEKDPSILSGRVVFDEQRRAIRGQQGIIFHQPLF